SRASLLAFFSSKSCAYPSGTQHAGIAQPGLWLRHFGLDDLAVVPLWIRGEQRAHLLVPLVLLGIGRILRVPRLVFENDGHVDLVRVAIHAIHDGADKPRDLELVVLRHVVFELRLHSWL